MRHADAISQPGHAGDGDALAISLLGPMTLSRNDHVIELNGPKRRALLAFLVIHRGVTMPRDSIVEALWPHSHTGREDSTLQVHVSHVRDRIEAHRSADPHVVITRGSGYCIAAEAVSVDIDRFQALASAGRVALTGVIPPLRSRRSTLRSGCGVAEHCRTSSTRTSRRTRFDASTSSATRRSSTAPRH